MKNVWRRLVDMMVDLQRDMQRKELTESSSP